MVKKIIFISLCVSALQFAVSFANNSKLASCPCPGECCPNSATSTQLTDYLAQYITLEKTQFIIETDLAKYLVKNLKHGKSKVEKV